MFFRKQRVAQTAAQAARELAEQVVRSAQQYCNGRELRAIIEYDSQIEEERGRIFNELVVTAIIFARLTLQTISAGSKGERRAYWREVHDQLIPAYLEWMKEIGVAEEHLKLFPAVFEQRLPEYGQWKMAMRQVMLEEGQSERATKPLMVNILAVGIGAVLHLRWQKKITRDPLKPPTYEWLSRLSEQVVGYYSSYD